MPRTTCACSLRLPSSSSCSRATSSVPSTSSRASSTCHVQRASTASQRKYSATANSKSAATLKSAAAATQLHRAVKFRTQQATSCCRRASSGQHGMRPLICVRAQVGMSSTAWSPQCRLFARCFHSVIPYIASWPCVSALLLCVCTLHSCSHTPA